MRGLLIRLQGAGLEPEPDELADVLWLAAWMEPAGAQPATATPAEKGETGPASQPPAVAAEEKPAPSPRSTDSGYRRKLPFPDRAPVYPVVKGQAGTLPAHPYWAPAVPLLPDVLDLGRSLRLLHRWALSSKRWTLDEEATVERIAEQRVLLAELKGVRERWFELVFVVDRAAGMSIWQPTLDELARLLGYNGAFRSVRTWYLDTEGPTAVLLSGRRSQRPCKAEELIVPGGRRLILVASDGVGRAWHTGSVNASLRIWSAACPVALLHLLPRHMWSGSALGRGRIVRLVARAPDSVNARLQLMKTTDVAADKGKTALKLPVLTLEPEAFAAWAQVLNGKAGAWIAGALFDSRSRYADPHANRPPEPTPELIHQRLQRFLKEASPRAQELAGYLSAAPLSLPVMRLVQRVLLPNSRQTDLAELVVSGLLRRVSPQDVHAQWLYYEFHAGVRDALIKLVPAVSAIRVLLLLSEFIASHTGQSLNFRALLADPKATGGLTVDDDNVRYFAMLGANVLRRLGGEYRRLADRLVVPPEPDASSPEEDLVAPDKPTPFRDRFHDSKTEGPEMVWLPGGTFTMGDDKSNQSDEKPAHQVTLSHFAVGKYPVTFDEYDAFCKATGRKKPDDRGWGRDRRPVIYVTWDDAQAYCQWLNQRTGQDYLLLTEAQWEYACRAGSETAWCFSDDEHQLSQYAWYGEDWGKGSTHPVGNKQANAWGLHDLHGNVWEWVQDWYGSYSSKPQQDPSGPESGSIRVLRGGSWGGSADGCRSAYRDWGDPGRRGSALGFRLARTGALSSYPFTLARQHAEEKPVSAPSAPESRYQPYQGFQDHLKDGTASPEMVYLPGGTFKMGDSQGKGYEDERPVHDVTLDAFAIGRYLVTVGEFQRFVEATNYRTEAECEGGAYVWDGKEWGKKADANWCNPYFAQEDRHPVVCVSWNDAVAYCEWLSEKTNEQYSLPSEAEWEYACRASNEAAYCFGDDERLLEAYAWYSKNAEQRTHPVGEKRANLWGLYDMHGNVWEWVRDWYGNYPKESRSVMGRIRGLFGVDSKVPQHNPSGPESGSSRVVRGGSWFYSAGLCRSAYRFWYDPGYRSGVLGFRLARRV